MSDSIESYPTSIHNLKKYQITTLANSFNLGDLKNVKRVTTQDIDRVVMIGSLQENELKNKMVIENAKNCQRNCIVVDMERGSDNEIEVLEYLRIIGEITKETRFTRIDQDTSSLIANLTLPEGTQELTQKYIKSIVLNQNQLLLLVDTQIIFQGAFSLIQQQREKLQNLILRDDDQIKIMLINHPLYCSSLTDKCTALANLMRSNYQQSIYDEEIRVPLIISGGSDCYERTYPKYEQRHQEYEDPTYFSQPEFPTYINLNGLKTPSENSLMLLQKQQWSAFLRKIPSFSILEISPHNKNLLNITSYDLEGHAFDNFILDLTPSEKTRPSKIASIITYMLFALISISLFSLVYKGPFQSLQVYSQSMSTKLGLNNEEPEEDSQSQDDDSEEQDDSFIDDSSDDDQSNAGAVEDGMQKLPNNDDIDNQ